MTLSPFHHLRCLARLCGVKLDYWDNEGRHRVAPPAALLAVLRALGVAIGHAGEAEAILTRHRLGRWQRPLEPVTVAWQGTAAALTLRLPEAAAGQALTLTARLETGETRTAVLVPADCTARPARRVAGGGRFVRLRWPIPADWPQGYHQLELTLAGERHAGWLFIAPERLWQPEAAEGAAGGWGVFLPLYALATGRGRGAGDLGDFRRLTEWAAGQGAQVVATLPMLAAFLGDAPGPVEYSPYAPVSRLMLNEFFIDLAAVPELGESAEARRVLASAAFEAEAAALRAEPLVDYPRQARLQRQVLEPLARDLNARRAAFDAWLEAHPAVRDYARFRAACEHHAAWWGEWPPAARDGRLTAQDYDPAVEHYHAYVQWIAQEQMEGLARLAEAGSGQGLYLDMPLGVNGAGYDVWHRRGLFAMEAGGGAPPDAFFSEGQNWGFPPLHPERSREEGHAYWRASIRRLAELAGVLRIDHVMGLHRLYWVPQGSSAREGVYVRYPAAEWYAILAIESWRARTRIVGENLGTVPPAVNAAMTRHAMQGMYVLQFSVRADGETAIAPPPAGSAASLNTHDMATFPGWWHEQDIDVQAEMGLLDEAQTAAARLARSHVRDSILYFLRRRDLLGWDRSTVEDVLRGCLLHLARSPAAMLLIGLEDLWGEQRPQNVPGTGPAERPNWRRRAALPFEAWTIRPELSNLFREVNQVRRDACGPE